MSCTTIVPIRERDAAAFISILIRGRLIRDSIKQCVLETLANTRYFPLKKHCAKYMLGKRERYNYFTHKIV